eukprot:5577087-Alexandrium_andersonii.AAC.1
MSASLVGSEMCIRDRSASSGRPVEVGAHGPATVGPCWTWRARNPARSTVSYTHLTLPTICSV